jgi:general secretion pathway protein I
MPSPAGPMMRLPKRQRKDSGFTLIEILVAFAILGLASGALIAGFGTSLERAALAANARRAALAASSALELIGTEYPLQPSVETADIAKNLRFTIRISDYDDSAPPPSDEENIKPPLVPYAIEVHATAGTGAAAQSVDLATIRLGPPP